MRVDEVRDGYVSQGVLSPSIPIAEGPVPGVPSRQDWTGGENSDSGPMVRTPLWYTTEWTRDVSVSRVILWGSHRVPEESWQGRTGSLFRPDTVPVVT